MKNDSLKTSADGPAKYDPVVVEDKWYAYWLRQEYFHSEPDDRKPYTIVIPPPNVTGVLHMGHMLNNTIQDVLTRRARMLGFNACWVPGTDHASIATEAKVVQMLRERGIKKSDLSREEFLKYAWEWKEKYGGIILEQLKKLGASCDWERTRFTMEPALSDAVVTTFIDLYEKGLIYRGLRMVNWDPQGRTALSDEEVIYKETNAKLYYIRYAFAAPGLEKEYLTIATTRPETILADTAICVNPKDERFARFVGKYVRVPFIGREIPVIADEYVDMEFGTGCLKVTPAHDVNDYALGQKHQLPVIDILDDAGFLNERAEDVRYIGKDRFAVRRQIAADLEEAGFLAKTEEYNTQVGTSERTGAVIEPKLSLQWWVDMKAFIGRNPEVLGAVMNDDIRFYPAKMKNTYRHWIDNIKDWCISRQLWWGQQIPAWYDEEGNFVVAKTEEEAVEKIRAADPSRSVGKLRQDEDVLDTWFSSWLWPISVFDGLARPGNEDISYYYPTTDLVTAPEIMFFWVARMIMAGYEWRGEKPFSNVYYTGIVRDKQRRKMSKSLGNSPDPLDLIAKYGADGVRMGMLLCSPAGNDILFDESQVEQGRNFANKIWNALRLVKGWEVQPDVNFGAEVTEGNRLALAWMRERLNASLESIGDRFGSYRLSEALMLAYKLVWDDFCSWYLEMVKPPFGQAINESVYNGSVQVFEDLMKLLHPFMPFITEEVWQTLGARTEGESIMIQQMPGKKEIESVPLDRAMEAVTRIRELRNSKGISPKEALAIEIKTLQSELYEPFFFLIRKLANVSTIGFVQTRPEGTLSMPVVTDEIFVFLNQQLDKHAEQDKINKEILYLEGFMRSVEAKLSNERFVANAKPELVEKERQKKTDAELKIGVLRDALAALG